jgi:Ca2+-binding RTX toxin-like protein
MPRITGTVLADILTGTPKRDLIFGLEGDDELRGGPGNDVLDAGLGRDLILGEEGNDRIIGGSHVLSISETGADDDVIDGGSGEDWVTYASLKQPNGIVIHLREDGGLAIVSDPNPGDFPAVQVDELYGIENAIGAPHGVSVLWGDSGNNVLQGIGPRTHFISSDGDDTHQTKGKGIAILSFPDPSGVVVDLPNSRVSDGYGDTDILRIRGPISVRGSDCADVLIGNKGRNWLDGRDGQDELHGGKGSDILSGGEHFFSELANDLIDGGGGSDWLVLNWRGEAPLTVDLSAGTAKVLDEVDTLQSIET